MSALYRYLIVCGMMVVMSLSVAGQEAGAASYDTILEGFFTQLNEGEHAKALQVLYASNPWLSANRDQITQLTNQFVGLSGLLGDYLGHERVVVQPLGGRFVYILELAYFEREPLQLHFTFYKAKNKWQLFTIAYDEDADETAKALAMEKLAD